MKIEHSNQINDFLCFYIETRLNGELLYETIINYLQLEFTIVNLKTKEELDFKFITKDESEIEKHIKIEVEKLIHKTHNK